MNHQQLQHKIARQIKRMKKAERDKPNVLAQTVYMGTLGLVIILPIIGGMYLGLWLDSLQTGYSSCWTLSLLLLGVVVGIFNVYFLIRN